jgi:hypothetical protein
MSNYRRINNDTSIVVVGRTAPVTPGQQVAANSLPVILASDQPAIPVEEQNKIQSEVALSLLGIPRSEVALGIFADVNTYDVNPSEWSAIPLEKSILNGTTQFELSGISTEMNWGLSHLPDESGALIEAPANKNTILTSKRFFRYQPGRVSAATFGVKTSICDGNPIAIDRNPPIRKYGIFDNFDGYYWETRGTGKGDEFAVVRRTSSLIKRPLLEFAVSSQTEDYGIVGTRQTSSLTSTASALSGKVDGNKLIIDGKSSKVLGNIQINMIPLLSGGNYKMPVSTAVTQIIQTGDNLQVTFNKSLGFTTNTILSNIQFSYAGDLVVVRDGLLLTHAAIYDNSLLKPTTYINISACSSATGAITLSGSSGLRLGQFVRYDKTVSSLSIFNTTVTKTTLKVESISSVNGNDVVKLRELDGTADADVTANGIVTGHTLVTPVPFIFPKIEGADADEKADIMFPYKRDYDINRDTIAPKGAIDTYIINNNSFADFKDQIDAVNNGIRCATYESASDSLYGVVDGWSRWILDNVDPEYYGAYEYRVPRSRFSGDFLDASADRSVVYSDKVKVAGPEGGSVIKYPGQPVQESTTLTKKRTSVWDFDFSKVVMNKIEFSWYGAVGAVFLAYVPVSNNEARWVRIHHIRASNQLKTASLGNATLPITYNVYGGGTEASYGLPNNLRQRYIGGASSSEFITKYGASYYIDGGDRGTVRLFNYAQDDANDIEKSNFIYTGVNTISAGGIDTVKGPYLVMPTVSATDLLMFSTISGANIPNNNIRVTYIEPHVGTDSKVFLNKSITAGSANDTINFTLDTPQILFGITSKTNINTSTGYQVRNRVQVYPTKLSTGTIINSNNIISLRLLKNCIFQTTSLTRWTKTIRLSASPTADSNKLNTSGLTTNITSSLSSTPLGNIVNNDEVYGWFRVYTNQNIPANHSTVFGILRYTDSQFLFTPKQSLVGNVYIIPSSYFLVAKNYNNAGSLLNTINSDDREIERLSSVIVNTTNRRPIPNTGTEVSNFFLSNGSEVYDLTPYFDYNKDYISYPLTNVADNLFITVKTTTNSGSVSKIASSLTWEEQ